MSDHHSDFLRIDQHVQTSCNNNSLTDKLVEDAYAFGKGCVRAGGTLAEGTLVGAGRYTAKQISENPSRVLLEAAGFAAIGAVGAATLPESAAIGLAALGGAGALAWASDAYNAGFKVGPALCGAFKSEKNVAEAKEAVARALGPIAAESVAYGFLRAGSAQAVRKLAHTIDGVGGVNVEPFMKHRDGSTVPEGYKIPGIKHHEDGRKSFVLERQPKEYKTLNALGTWCTELPNQMREWIQAPVKLTSTILSNQQKFEIKQLPDGSTLWTTKK